MASLEEQIRARIKQAQDRDISRKADWVLQELGSHKEKDGEYIQSRTSTFQCSSFGIQSSSDSTLISCLIITTRDGRKVFHESGSLSKKEIRGYIPGDWERELDALYQRAMAIYNTRNDAENDARKRQQKEDRSSALAALRQKWGL